MKLSIEFEDLVLKQLESFGSFMGVRDLVVYLASAKNDSKTGFELYQQWPQVDKLLIPIDDDPELRVPSQNRRWYPIQDKNILIGVLRVETDFIDSDWPLALDSRLKALSLSLSKSFAIEIERQRNDEEINYLRNQVGVIIHQLRNPLAALTTYAKLLVKRLGSDKDSIEIVESMLIEQKQINEYVSSFEKISKPMRISGEVGEERLLLPPNLDTGQKITIQEILLPILERGKANAELQNRDWTQSAKWPSWTLKRIDSKYGVIAEIVANLLENAFKYSDPNVEIGIIITDSGILIFDDGRRISNEEKEKIFDKGFRGFASKNKDGTGVGLFLAKKLATQIKGDLRLIGKSLNDEDIQIAELKKSNMFYLKIPTGELNE